MKKSASARRPSARIVSAAWRRPRTAPRTTTRTPEELYKAYKNANPTIEEANDRLATNKDRLKEISEIPWYDRTPDIINEENALKTENEELQNQIDKLKDLAEKKAKANFESRSLTVGTGEKYYTTPGAQLGEVKQD